MPSDKSQGKGKGKMRIDVCRWDDTAQEWALKTLPAQAAAQQVAHGHAVYPVEGACPVDPPTFEDDAE